MLNENDLGVFELIELKEIVDRTKRSENYLPYLKSLYETNSASLSKLEMHVLVKYYGFKPKHIETSNNKVQDDVKVEDNGNEFHNRTNQLARNLIAEQAIPFVRTCIDVSQEELSLCMGYEGLISLDEYNTKLRALDNMYWNPKYREYRSLHDGFVVLSETDVDELMELITESLKKYDLEKCAVIGWVDTLISSSLRNLEDALDAKSELTAEEKITRAKLKRWELVSMGMNCCSIIREIRNNTSVSWIHQNELSIHDGNKFVCKIGFDGTDRLAKQR